MCCLSCGRNYPIVNAKYTLCATCNFKRLHNGMTRFEVAMDKRKKERRQILSVMKRESILKSSLLNEKRYCKVKGCDKETTTGRLCAEHLKEEKKNKKKPKTRTSQQIRESKAKSTLRELKIQAKNKQKANGNVCEGCLKSSAEILDYSHILSVKQRKDLENDAQNKNMLCRSCHQDWESNEAERMLKLACFMDNMKYIRSVDKERFWKIYFILNDAMKITECNNLEKIDNDYINNNDR